MSFNYPTAHRDDSEKAYTDYHGTRIHDPYNWLEAPDAPETKAWVDKQNEITESYISKFPHREALKQKLTEVYNYEKVSCPFRYGDKYFFFKNDGLQNQDVLFMVDATPTGEIDIHAAKVLIDPNTLTADGTAALYSLGLTETASYIAYGVSYSGSDWQTIHVKNVATGEQLPDKLEWCKFTSIAWTHDEKGFFYVRYPVPASLANDQSTADTDSDIKRGSEVDSNVNQKIYYHRLGDQQSQDVLVFETPEHEKWMFGPEVSDDGDYLLISIHESTARVNRLFYTKLQDKAFVPPAEGEKLPVVKIIDNFDAEYSYITNEGSLFYFQSNANAPRNKVITIDFERPEPENWRDLIPHSEDVLKSSIVVNRNSLVLSYTHNVKGVLKLYTLNGEYVKDFPMPDIGSVAALNARKQDNELFFKFTSFTTPGIAYRYNFANEKLRVFHETRVGSIDSSMFETKQVWYRSKDGTSVPMFIVAKKGVQLNGQNPVLLYGYGGFSISMTPNFSAFRLAIINHLNIVFAIANIRGGAEFGEEWHEQGTLGRKQNVFDDFIAAAEHLIETNYTSKRKIAIIGGSNGGLLVGACANQRPDLYGAAIAQVGVMDMLKFHKFTIGYAWVSDYGSSDKAEDFEYLIKYSPLHNIRANADAEYPAVLVTTSDHDDRVVPLHSYKYAAELQHTIGSLPTQKNPLLIRVETKAGHGAGRPTTKIIEEFTDIYSFLAMSLGIDYTA